MQREFYKERLINSYGSDFEKKTQELFKEYYGDDFKIIKPYGNQGDKKNDGYIPDQGVFFQIYGPQEGILSSEKQAIKKFKEDLEELEKHCINKTWKEMKEFNFVYNDKNRGVSPSLEKLRVKLEEIKNIKCNILGIYNLMNLYDSLPEERQEKLVGYLEKKQNPDYKIYKDLEEKFFTSGLIDKLDNFHFGNVHNINYFDFNNGWDSSDYINYIIDKDPYYIFKDEELEKLRIEFCENYSRCMYLLAMNYFPSDQRDGTLITTWRHKDNVGEEFEKAKATAVWALRTLLRECYKKISDEK